MLNFSKNRSLSNLAKSGMPQMGSTLNGWEVPLTLIKITQNVVDGDLVAMETQINFKGVWQPFSMQQLALLPEGQRDWSHYWVHTQTAIELNTADKFIFDNKRYKVIERKDYNLNGYYEYHVILDYENVEPVQE